jgi:hypothetical protein
MPTPESTAKTPVTMRVLLERLNRKLKLLDCQVRKAKSGGDSALGQYYIVNVLSNQIAEQNIDPEMMGRELGVLRFWERVVPAVALLAFTIG